MRRAVLPAVMVASAVVSCFGAPATRSPLRERLAAADTPVIEDAARTCLEKGGWRVDPVGELVAGANVVTAAKGGDQTQVYIQAPDVKPRVTGGPDDGDPFWACLPKELETAKSTPPPSSDTP